MSGSAEDLYTAAFSGNLPLVQQLTADSSASGVQQQFAAFGGRTVLHAAAACGHQQVVQLLLACGAQVDAACWSGQSALHLAATHGHEAVTQQLLAAKANVELADRLGSTPLHLAAAHGHSRVVALLLRAKAPVNTGNNADARPLHMAATAGHTAVAVQLLAAGASACVPDAEGLSPLHRGAAAGHAAVVRAMLRSQPVPTPELQIAVCFADIFGHVNVLAQLLFQLNRQDGKAAAGMLPQVGHGVRATQQLPLAMLRAWSADTAGVTAAAQAVSRQQQTLAAVKAGLQHLAMSLALQQTCGQQQQQQQQEEQQQEAHEKVECAAAVSEGPLSSELSTESVQQAMAC
jgi:ankyrin repeat protein